MCYSRSVHAMSIVNSVKEWGCIPCAYPGIARTFARIFSVLSSTCVYYTAGVKSDLGHRWLGLLVGCISRVIRLCGWLLG